MLCNQFALCFIITLTNDAHDSRLGECAACLVHMSKQDEGVAKATFSCTVGNEAPACLCVRGGGASGGVAGGREGQIKLGVH